MGTFFIAPATTLASICQRLDRQHQDHGFQLARRIEVADYSLYLYRNLHGNGGLFVELEDGGFACLVGQLLYRAATGEEALRLYASDLSQQRVDNQRVIGQFTLILKDANGLRLLTDSLGFYQIYLNVRTRIISSSFWSLLELLPAASGDPEGIYEYAWNGASFGGKTFINEIRRLPANAELVVDQELVVKRTAPPASQKVEGGRISFEGYLDDHAERLRAVFQDLAQAYGERLHVSFSSGYDSRLILAGLKAAGLRPRLFVYGQDGDKDVEVAEQIAAGEGLQLNIIDKSRLVNPEVATSTDRQQADFVRFDGWRVDGVFDDGVDTPDRLARHDNGGVPLNGSLGEIYRNFFYIPDRAMPLSRVVESFFSGYAPSACTEAFNVKAYVDSLVRAFQSELGTHESRVTRTAVESLYPLVRGRYWTGRDVNLNLRFGPMHFPFMQAQLIEGTSAIPLDFKNDGHLEAKLIDRLDPALAAYPSGYGYRFCEPPPVRYRAKSWMTIYRPAWLRARSYRLRFAKPRAFPNYLSADRLSALMDTSFPCMRPYFHPERLHDPNAFNRIATMEYIFQRYSVA